MHGVSRLRHPLSGEILMSIVFSILILGLAVIVSWPLGKWMVWAMQSGEPVGRFRQGMDTLFQKIGGAFTSHGQDWKAYCWSMLLFNACMFTIVYAILSLQQALPLNPDGKGALEASLIFNTVASFTANTNLQHYSGEVSLSYFSQIFGLMWLQFVSAATGIAALAALCRGLTGKREVGNF
jgi:K+-transporting ATPase ATPase A chain